VIFGEYGKAVSAFISGYLVSKLDKLVEMILSPTTLQVPVASFRLVGSTSCFVTAMLITYVIGAYVFASSESVNSATTGAPKELDTKNS
jgi:fructose-specific phosphotransferase system IIC component